MEIRFAPLDLAHIDGLRYEAAALAFFEDERPLRGAAGLCDWRLLGRVSRHIERGRLDGHAGEVSLLPARPRLPFDKIVLFGLGTRDSFDTAAFDRALGRMLDALRGLKLRTFVIALPGRSAGVVPAIDAVRAFASVALERGEFDEAVVLEEPDALKSLPAVVDAERRRIRAVRELEADR
jgi:hypothetical protein